MARRRSSKKSNYNYRPIYTFPELHERVCSAVEDDDVEPHWVDRDDDNARDHENEYSTNVMGTFRCENGSCSNDSWGSKKVAIVIRGYEDDGYNAEVFNQRCKACNQLGVLTLHENSYVERVAYRVKKWAGVTVEQPHYGQPGEGPPHERDLCEGCKAGYCLSGGVDDLSFAQMSLGRRHS
ncbi:zinc-binding domain-containing protein [Microdochium trichocladiopsis]|uniref:Zinc-binding domain-containing protein n=1 Tax=Microdochium trichocladiopsis TaxID=1682393 RepID=A0A9P8XZL2_9PEZI|nr:zinc-binding domain-containing protein [Microdochium trichocladiopsis]KAH7026625.1 zinc-binding domain-containing protein [Microdochium trichocladiopsis]